MRKELFLSPSLFLLRSLIKRNGRMGEWQKQKREVNAAGVFADTQGKNILLKSDIFNTGCSQRGSAELCSHLPKGWSTERLNCKVNICSFPKLISVLFQLHSPLYQLVVCCHCFVKLGSHRQSAFCPLLLIRGEKKHLKNLTLIFLEADWWILKFFPVEGQYKLPLQIWILSSLRMGRAWQKMQPNFAVHVQSVFLSLIFCSFNQKTTSTSWNMPGFWWVFITYNESRSPTKVHPHNLIDNWSDFLQILTVTDGLELHKRSLF